MNQIERTCVVEIFGTDVVATHLDVVATESIEPACVDIGGKYVPAGANTIGEPDSNGTDRSTNFDTSPARADTETQQQSLGSWVLHGGQVIQPLIRCGIDRGHRILRHRRLRSRRHAFTALEGRAEAPRNAGFGQMRQNLANVG
jgi:hypothetical protein